MAIDYVKIGERIHTSRVASGLSQEALAEMVNLTRNHLSNIENGRKAPSLEATISIAEALKITPDALLIDSFPTTDSNDIDQLFAGCPADEAAVLLEAVKSLKQTLDKYRITHK